MFQNTASHTVLTSNVKAYMINLVKIIESITDAQHMTLLQKWAVFLYYGHLSEHELVKVLMKDEVFRKAAEIMRIVNNDEELKDMAFARMKREMDQITRLDNAKKQGFLEGIIEGEVKGQKKTLEIYRCLKQGIDVCEIASLLKMNVQEVIELKNEFEIF
ncbi:MAG: PD-(D/E)XK nuclease family transposase [Erysipelotrichaceae bacterium]|nr:PD-(D/E)XK nuclease family transposase [Erysipelotrichaceae bacterium]